MYESVLEYFKNEYPELVGYLDNSGAFWPNVKNNTYPNELLERNIKLHESIGHVHSAVYQASQALANARLFGKLPNSG